jgi:phosphatidylglycerophosphatase A
VGLLAWWLLPQSGSAQLATIVAVFALGAWSGSVAERHFQRSDPGFVVLDEVLGMLVTLFMNPVGWVGALLAFLLFRIADIIKPYPADRLERLHGGVGIMADDAMAGVYANLALRAIVMAANAMHWSL